MSQSTFRQLLARWGLILGLVLIAIGLLGLYLHFRTKVNPIRSEISAGLICKVQQPPTSEHSGEVTPSSLFTGAVLKLTGVSKASLDETVVVNLCIQPASGLPEQRQQALKKHLLVQLSAVGLQVEPREKVGAEATSQGCLGSTDWTLRATAPGRYSAVLLAESTDDQPNQPVSNSSKPRWDFDLERPARLDIQFQDAWTTVIQKTWSPISAVLGVVLVITQIRLNLQQRRVSRPS